MYAGERPVEFEERQALAEQRLCLDTQQPIVPSLRQARVDAGVPQLPRIQYVQPAVVVCVVEEVTSGRLLAGQLKLFVVDEQQCYSTQAVDVSNEGIPRIPSE